MLGTIEELEKEIEMFQKNVAASNELQELLKLILEQIKQQTSEFGTQSSELIEKVESIPKAVERESLARNDKMRTEVASEIDRALQSFGNEQGKYIDSLKQTRDVMKDCESRLADKYAEFMEVLQKTNIANLYDQNNQLKDQLNKRTLILMIISTISIIVGIAGIIL